MKKIILPSLGLLTFMAACTSEELVDAQQAVVGSVDGRPTTEVLLNVENPGFEVLESRMSGSESADGTKYSWGWMEDDIVGGALFEDADGTITNSNYMTNYAFTRTDRGSGTGVQGSASFNTPSPVTVGSYIFYHQYDISSARKSFGHVLGGEDFPRVKGMVAGGDESLELIAGDPTKNFYFSPLAKIALDFDKDKFAAETATLPIKMTSAYSFLRLDITSELTPTKTTNYYDNFFITKVEVSTVKDGEMFEAGFTLNPQLVAAIQRDLYTNPFGILDTDVIDPKTGALVQNEEDMDAYNDAFNKVRTALRQDKYTFKNSFTLNGVNYTAGESVPVLTAVDANKTKTLVYELEEAYQLKSEEDHMVMWIPVPSGTYHNATETYNFNGATVTGTGAIKVVVYTTEGTATFFLKTAKTDGSGNLLDYINFKRDEPNRMTKVLYINDDSDPEKKTNIDFYAFNQNMVVGTENEWAYALDYIEEHNKEFSNKVPQIELVGNIAINSLPEYKIQVYGDKILTLEGDITFDPERTILGKGASQFPTLKVAEGFTLDFAAATENLEIINEGTVVAGEDLDIISLTSEDDASLVIEEGVNVNVNATDDVTAGIVTAEADAEFMVASTGDINLNSVTLANGVKMNLDGQEVTVENHSTASNAEIEIKSVAGSETNGLELNGTTRMTVNGGDYVSKGTTEIATGAVVTLNAKATNNGAVNVKGQLDADQKNYINGQYGVLTVSKAISEGRGNTGTVSFNRFDNYGNVATEAGDLTKNYFGGTIDVKTLYNHGEIQTNGELVVASGGTNYDGAVIRLLDDEYALIKLPRTYKNQGRVVIEVPENYCMYTYFKEWNHLEKLAEAGIIETTITSQEQYEEVLAEQKQYKSASDKFTAWDVINKVNVACNLSLTNVESKMSGYLKDIVLGDNATVDVANGLVIDELAAEGASTVIAAAAGKTATLNVNKVVVKASKDLTVNKGLTVKMAKNTTTMLDVLGTLNNYGALNSVADEKTPINTVVSGTMNNFGTIASKPVNEVLWKQNELDLVAAINKAFYALQNTWYVRNIDGDQWIGTGTPTDISKDKKALTLDLLIAFAKALNGSNVTPSTDLSNNGAFQYNGKTWKIFTANDDNYQVPGRDDRSVMTEAVIAELAKYASSTALSNKYMNKNNNGNASLIKADNKNITASSSIVKTYGYIKDYMKVTKNTGVIDLTAVGSSAYGYIESNAGGTLKGEFTIDFKSDFVK